MAGGERRDYEVLYRAHGRTREWRSLARHAREEAKREKEAMRERLREQEEALATIEERVRGRRRGEKKQENAECRQCALLARTCAKCFAGEAYTKASLLHTGCEGVRAPDWDSTAPLGQERRPTAGALGVTNEGVRELTAAETEVALGKTQKVRTAALYRANRLRQQLQGKQAGKNILIERNPQLLYRDSSVAGPRRGGKEAANMSDENGNDDADVVPTLSVESSLASLDKPLTSEELLDTGSQTLSAAAEAALHEAIHASCTADTIPDLFGAAKAAQTAADAISSSLVEQRGAGEYLKEYWWANAPEDSPEEVRRVLEAAKIACESCYRVSNR